MGCTSQKHKNHCSGTNNQQNGTEKILSNNQNGTQGEQNNKQNGTQVESQEQKNNQQEVSQGQEKSTQINNKNLYILSIFGSYYQSNNTQPQTQSGGQQQISYFYDFSESLEKDQSQSYSKKSSEKVQSFKNSNSENHLNNGPIYKDLHVYEES